MKTIEVRHLGITVKIRKQTSSRYIISDYTGGKRVRHVRTSESEAREKARELCGIMAHGRGEERELLTDADLKYDVRRAVEILKPTCLRLSRAAQVVADCCEMIRVDEIVAAVRYWKDHRPDRCFKPTPADEAVDAYLSRQTHLSERRRKTLACYLNAFASEFGSRMLDTVRTAELKDFLRSRSGWKSLTSGNSCWWEVPSVF